MIPKHSDRFAVQSLDTGVPSDQPKRLWLLSVSVKPQILRVQDAEVMPRFRGYRSNGKMEDLVECIHGCLAGRAGMNYKIRLCCSASTRVASPRQVVDDVAWILSVAARGGLVCSLLLPYS